MERAMGIEPTSEAWEACFIALKTHKLAAFCRFKNFEMDFNWSSGRKNRNWQRRVGVELFGLLKALNLLILRGARTG
jgi:hypothetical protein